MCDKNLNSHVGRQITCDNTHKEKRILHERKHQWSTPSSFDLTYTYCWLRLGYDFLMNNGASDMLLYVQTISN